MIEKHKMPSAQHINYNVKQTSRIKWIFKIIITDHVIRAQAGLNLWGSNCFSNDYYLFFFVPNADIFHCLNIPQNSPNLEYKSILAKNFIICCHPEFPPLGSAIIKESAFWLITPIYFVSHDNGEWRNGVRRKPLRWFTSTPPIRESNGSDVRRPSSSDFACSVGADNVCVAPKASDVAEHAKHICSRPHSRLSKCFRRPTGGPVCSCLNMKLSTIIVSALLRTAD